MVFSKISGVSVPLRGFRGLQGRSDGQDRDRNHRVSVPLRGFRGLQVESFFNATSVEVAFQSPCGVLGVCRAREALGRGMGLQDPVSVPLRGFRGLQGFSRRRNTTTPDVSVPLRGFRGLQGATVGDLQRWLDGRFSPLAGF